MSPHAPHDEPEDGNGRLLAAEFVLGLVQGDARTALARRFESDPSFASDVAFWEAQLGPIADAATPVDVPAHIWTRISAELEQVAAPRRAPQPSASLWNSLPFWRGFSLATSSLAAAGLALLLFTPAPEPVPAMVALLSLDDGRSGFMASLDRATGRVMLMPAIDASTPAEHVHELWLIPRDGTPRSLGTFEARGPIAMSLSRDLATHATPDAALAISVEPAGGSPTGQPTGPLVAQGKMHNI